MRQSLGILEQATLTAVRMLGKKHAYGRPISEEVQKLNGNTFKSSMIYTVLDRLEGKGYVQSSLSAPVAKRGGRSKRMFELVEAGETALAEAMLVSARMAGLDGDVQLSPGELLRRAYAREKFSLTDPDRGSLVRLLGYLQDLLEIEIHCDLENGELPADKAVAGHVRENRRKWAAAEEMVKKLTVVPIYKPRSRRKNPAPLPDRVQP